MPKSYNRPQMDTVKGWRTNYQFGTQIPISTTVYTGSTVQAVDDYRSFTGTSDPNWRLFRKQNGYLPTRDATDSVRLSRGMEVAQAKFHTWGGHDFTERVRLHVGYPPVITFPNELLDQAWFGLCQKVANNDFNLAVTMLEAQKTINFVADRARVYAKALRAFKRGDIVRAMRLLELTSLKGASTNWLSYKFGWLNLLNDAKNAAEYTARRHLNQTHHYTLHKRAKRITTKMEVLSANSGLVQQARALTTRTLVAKAWVTVRLENPTLRAAAEAGLTNPLAVLWEATPMSWVADYFTSIGDYLNHFSAFEGLTVLDKGYSWKNQMAGTYWAGLQPRYVNERHSSFNWSHYERRAGAWRPSVFRSLTPTLSKLSLNRLATVAALIRVLHR